MHCISAQHSAYRAAYLVTRGIAAHRQRCMLELACFATFAGMTSAAHDYETVNHVPAKGGSIDAAGPAVVHGMVFVNSGYGQWGGMPGNVLLAFSVK